jgi:hypothetical protein
MVNNLLQGLKVEFTSLLESMAYWNLVGKLHGIR